MIVVIQCAGSKKTEAASLRTADGRAVSFVANAQIAPDDGNFYARPDDDAGDGRTWRNLLSAINKGTEPSPPNLLAAADLYRPAVYQRLLESAGCEKLYILSAGWGLVRADFLLPVYDITFSVQAEGYKRRRNADGFNDFSMLPRGSDEPIIFFGGKDYLPLFRQLCRKHSGRRIVLFRSAQPLDCPECLVVKYETSRRTNWHYEAAERYMAGSLQLPV